MNLLMLKLDNVKNVGDINDSSIILFDSGDEYKYLILDNFSIQNCISNGVIYSKYKNLHSLIASNTKFINNYAGVAGGALFSPNYPQYYLFDYNNCEFMDNKAESHGNDYATNPSLIKLLNDDKYHDYKMKSGSYLPISFLIYDSYENIIHDHYHYYSDIYIKVLVEK
ncbi:hypothetical protein BCR36DRAFT_368851 [Piromyces finnis]|uniref:Uncharacterized protein n=1 Tax=Piromyces finnis TaxID=1754191 RepID=A0A1Y1VEU8_9FUNG|nr:hypothetical protein BCR36DRAFT_368851 [Piromyces finnis]|eukprot:ORX53830.1 hypothetical protein BCR36DRAFT_368851 [Piromyces finnis]